MIDPNDYTEIDGLYDLSGDAVLCGSADTDGSIFIANEIAGIDGPAERLSGDGD